MPEKKTGKGTAAKADLPEEETESLYTLSELGARLGAATEADVQHYIEGMTKADLIRDGAEVATRRIDKDSARLYGIAADFFDKADEDQLDNLVGVSRQMLRVAVWAAQQGSQRAEARGKGVARSGTSKQVRADEASTVRARAVARRKALRAGLRSLAAGQQPVLTAIETAHGTMATATTIGDSLDALAKIGRDMLKAPTPALKARLAEARLTKGYLDETVQLAKDVRAAGEVAGAVASGAAVAQTEVDYWDGINLHFLGTFMDVFEAGNEVDPTIPRLVPISLRTYFAPTRTKGAPEQPAPAPDAAKPA